MEKLKSLITPKRWVQLKRFLFNPLSGQWLQARWSPAQAVQSILWKELFAIVNSVNTWSHGHQWAKQKILFHCDNKAVVDIWCKGSRCDPGSMALVCLLYFCATHFASSGNSLGRTSKLRHSIDIDDALPVRQPVRWISHAKRSTPR